jgi:hypothetical protein
VYLKAKKGRRSEIVYMKRRAHYERDDDEEERNERAEEDEEEEQTLGVGEWNWSDEATTQNVKI